jgi:hypothetical protein
MCACDLKIAASLVRCLVVSFMYFVFDQKQSFEVDDPWRLSDLIQGSSQTQPDSLFALTLLTF